MSQLKLLAAHLATGKSISPAEAKEVYGISRLAARIHDLQGVAIIGAEWHTDPLGKRYARYSAWDAKEQRALKRYLGE